MGLDPSPYTVKVASYFTFKGIDFQWLSRTRKREKLFQAHAKVQLIPLLFLPSGETLQDSTLIIERLEGEHPEPRYPSNRSGPVVPVLPVRGVWG